MSPQLNKILAFITIISNDANGIGSTREYGLNILYGWIYRAWLNNSLFKLFLLALVVYVKALQIHSLLLRPMLANY